MSRKRQRKTRKQKDRTNERVEHLREIKSLKEKISEYEREILDGKEQNLKQLHIRNLKIFVGVGNLLMPFVVVGGLTVGGFKFCGGGFPFYRDEITKCKKHSLEYETDAEINIKSEYVVNEWYSDSLPSDSLVLYTPWHKEDGSFVRIKREYDLPDECFFDLSEAVLHNDYNYIDENYNNFKEEKEVSDILPKEENDYYIQTGIYELDEEDILKYPETDGKNKIITIVECIIILGIGGVIVKKRNYSFLGDIKEIKDDYNSNIKDIDELEEKLANTKEKLLVLTKKNGGKCNE